MSGKSAYTVPFLSRGCSNAIKKLIPEIKHKSVYLKYWISSDSR